MRRCFRFRLRAVGPLIPALVFLLLSRAALSLSFAGGRQRRSTGSNGNVNGGGVASPSSTSTTTPSAQEQQFVRDEESARTRRLGQAKRRREKNARLEDRVSYLEGLLMASSSPSSSSSTSTLTTAQQKELEGLLLLRDSFEEQYDPAAFTAEHVEFKRRHNAAFVALARYCHDDRAKNNCDGGGSNGQAGDNPNVFYLDGPDCATSIALQEAGFDPSSCYVANRHGPTCQILRERLPEENVLHCTAAEALTPDPQHGEGDDDATKDSAACLGGDSFSNIDFAAYYFDGCGGYVPHVIGMMSAALLRGTSSSSSTHDKQHYHKKTTAVGFSLTGGNRDVIQKETEVCRALTVIARTRGMRTRHVLDDPGRYGIPEEVGKIEGGTFTSWMLLEEDT